MPAPQGGPPLEKLSGSDGSLAIHQQSSAVDGLEQRVPDEPTERSFQPTSPVGQPKQADSKPDAFQRESAGGSVVVPGEGEAPAGSPPAPGEIWLDGGVLACACPGCGAPMSIRLWLRVADCWRCGTSIELTEEQERAAWELLRQQAAQTQAGPGTHGSKRPVSPSSGGTSLSKSSPSPPSAAPVTPSASPSPPRASPSRDFPRGHSAGIKPSNFTKVGGSSPSSRYIPHPPSGLLPPREREFSSGSAPSPLPGGRRRIPAAERAFRQRLRQAQQGRPWRLRVQDWLKNLPAWLISLLLHMVALLLLGLWMPEEKKPTGFVFSTSVGPYDLETELGQQPEIEVLRPEFDEGGLASEPLSLENLLGDPNMPKALLDPGLHRPDSSSQPPDPLVNEVAPALRPGSLLRGRDPSVRNKILVSQGGTSATEAAVARALRWISRHQNPDGSFSLHAFNQTSECQGQCDGLGIPSDVAGTALALLPMLGAGHTHREGEYASVVQAGLQWLLARQKENGDLQDPGGGQMYAHGLASIVLCEAYALTGDSQLRNAAQRALNFIVQAQHPAGGWRYRPGQEGDTSMVGWQLMALNSGRMAGLSVPTETLMKASRYLDSAQTDRSGSSYGYMPGIRASPAMTAEALLCRQYLGWPRTHPGLRGGIRLLLDRHPPKLQDLNIYYWYYAAQVFHHYGGTEWERWNSQMRRILVDSQVRTGHAAGSWNPDHAWGGAGGRLYQTALTACTLEVYYRYLPLYRQQAVGEAPPDGTASSLPSSAQKPASAPEKPSFPADSLR